MVEITADVEMTTIVVASILQSKCILESKKATHKVVKMKGGCANAR